jgi:phosphatidylglycerophosphate synthase
MLSSKQRLIQFLGICILIRSLGALISYLHPYSVITKVLAILYFLIGISMLYLFIANKRQNAPEGGGITWWNNLRPIHAILFILFAVFTLNRNKYSYFFLIGDVILGLTAFITHRITS